MSTKNSEKVRKNLITKQSLRPASSTRSKTPCPAQTQKENTEQSGQLIWYGIFF